MTKKQIEQALVKLCEDSRMFFNHNDDGTGEFMWFDGDAWCVNTYTTVPELAMSSMPIKMFGRE